ncbi:MAG: heavy metal translocating P-type ATPase, partial [Tumebacillaceae bacterium]
VEEVEIGDIMIVRPGEKIAMDGIVLLGATTVNEASITGESMPVEKGKGAEVYAGTINQQGSVEVRVTKLVEDSTLQKIIHLVQEAQGQKAKSEAFVDQFSKVYTPLVIALAFLITVIPPLLFGGLWEEWLYRGLALLVVACPCALIISTPVSIVAAIGNAARNGVLIKGGVYLEEMARISVVAFDKTGTLTAGRPEVTHIIALDGRSEDDLLQIAASIENHSEHPVATAIVRRAKQRNLQLVAVADFQSLTGSGVVGSIAGETYRIGKPQLFQTLPQVQGLQNQGNTVMVLGQGDHILGIIAVADEVRALSGRAIEALRQAGIRKTVMLTGDNDATARAIASQVGVDDYRSELLPQDKVESVKLLQKQHGTLAMVGDGINDAPALATANVGIAMGVSGTDTALETADIALMADDLTKLPFTIQLSKATLRVIKQNIYFSLLVKTLALVAVFPGWLSLFIAILSDVGAALLVTLNGLRLLRIKP